MAYGQCGVERSDKCSPQHWKDDIKEKRILYKCVKCGNTYYTILNRNSDFFDLKSGKKMYIGGMAYDNRWYYQNTSKYSSNTYFKKMS